LEASKGHYLVLLWAIGHRVCFVDFLQFFFALDKRPAPFGMNALKGGKKKWHIYIFIYVYMNLN